jgi:predicted nucleic acid-binding protein
LSLVIDASVALSWHFPDERNEIADRAFEFVTLNGAVVPFHWRAEIANGFAIAVRRRRMTREYQDGALARLDAFDIRTDRESERRIWNATLELCQAHSLTAYDAAYLELSERLHLPMASLDNELVRAARKIGVEVFAGQN